MKTFFIHQYLKSKSKFEKTKDFFLGEKKYQKFVIISDARTGSTLLMQLLNLHPNIIALGEEFKNLKQKSCKQIWNEIFRKRPRNIKWVGFKLFYFHPWQNPDQDVWDFIEKDKGIVIIHLTRRNILRSIVSKQIGLKTRKWTENVNRPHQISEEEKRVFIDAKSCLVNLENIDSYIEKTNHRFRHNKVISVVYEDLDKNNQEEMNRLYDELGVDRIKIRTIMKKQNPENLEQLIENFKILKTEFTGTKWEYLFKEKI